MIEAHPFALLLPPLTDDEYAALKSDIAAHGILYPVIVDDAGLVLDGVHRVRIAGELGIEPPVSQMGHLDDDRKLHLAVGLNMRRRHLDADRRRDLVRRLHTEQGLSRRKLSAITGWSKSTIDRDLKTSPFETALAYIAKMRDEIPDDAGANEAVRCLPEVLSLLYGMADQDWKAQRQRSDFELTQMTLLLYEVYRLCEVLVGEREPGPWIIRDERWDTLIDWFESKDDAEQELLVRRARVHGVLDRWTVPDGTLA